MNRMFGDARDTAETHVRARTRFDDHPPMRQLTQDKVLSSADLLESFFIVRPSDRCIGWLRAQLLPFTLQGLVVDDDADVLKFALEPQIIVDLVKSLRDRFQLVRLWSTRHSHRRVQAQGRAVSESFCAQFGHLVAPTHGTLK